MSIFKFEFQKLPKLIVILGPTASGKTDLAIKSALRLSSGQALRVSSKQVKKRFGINGVEIVSADSRQVYKEMDIATAKPLQTKNLKLKTKNYLVKGINHYLIDVVYPNQEFNVAIYKKLAIKAIKDIQRQGKIPFLVGGTGLYIQSIVDNIEFPKAPPQKKLREKLEKKTTKELFGIYKKLDSKGAKFIEKKNRRRLIRAIEVCKITKKPFWQQRKKDKPLFDVLQIGIKLPKKELKKRVEKRVEKMFKSGLEKEVKKLVKRYGWVSPLQTIGYQEWSSFARASEDKKRIFFPRTKNEKEKVKQEIIKHTLQFAKRQMTWFKRSKRILWIKNYREAEKLIKKFLQI